MTALAWVGVGVGAWLLIAVPVALLIARAVGQANEAAQPLAQVTPPRRAA